MVDAELPSAVAPRQLVDPREPTDEQPLHLELGRGDEVARWLGHDTEGLEVQIEARAGDEARRLDLEEALLLEVPAHGRQRAGALT